MPAASLRAPFGNVTEPSFALGFLTGQEMDWLPEAMRLLRDELPNIEGFDAIHIVEAIRATPAFHGA